MSVIETLGLGVTVFGYSTMRKPPSQAPCGMALFFFMQVCMVCHASLLIPARQLTTEELTCCDGFFQRAPPTL